MKTIMASARLLDDKGGDAVGIKLSLEAYLLSGRRWLALGSAVTAAKGAWRVEVGNLPVGAAHAPMLRLTEAGTPAPRVIAEGGGVRYDTRTQRLTVDFGTVERLDDTAYPLAFSNSVFQRTKHTVAGQPKRKTVSTPILLRNAAAVDLNTTTLVAGNVRPAPTGTTVTAGRTPTKPVVSPGVQETFDAEVLRFKANEAQLQAKISDKDRQLATNRAELQTANNRITALESSLAQSKAKEQTLKAQNETLASEAGRKAPIQDVAANIGAEVDAANRKLVDQKRPYQFGRIELDLKGTLGKNGQSLTLANMNDVREAGSGNGLSGVKLELLPERDRSAVDTAVSVPDVTGLTETAVRRVLQSVGLRLEVVNQAISAGSKTPVGQSIRQSPKAGDSLPRSNTVLVVFTVSPGT